MRWKVFRRPIDSEPFERKAPLIFLLLSAIVVIFLAASVWSSLQTGPRTVLDHQHRVPTGQEHEGLPMPHGYPDRG